MKKTTLRVVVAGAVCAAVAVFLPQLSQAQVAKCSDLFISEYVDGPGKNKAVEIYNPTEGDIDLSGYSIHVYMNGAPTPLITPLAGVLSSHGVHVLSNPLADAEVLGKAQQTSVHYNPNGDDAVALEKDGTLLDIVGEIGVDPGPDGWPVTPAGLPAAATKANGLVRMPACGAGEHDWTHCQEHWKVYAQDDYRRLGWHMSACRRGAPEVNFTTLSQNCFENACNTRYMTVEITGAMVPGTHVNVIFNEISASGVPNATFGVDLPHTSTMSTMIFYDGGPTDNDASITINDDATVESNETARIGLEVLGIATAGSDWTTDIIIKNDDVVGIEDSETASLVKVRWDMDGQNLWLTHPHLNEQAQVQVVDLLGQMVASQPLSKGSITQVPLPSVASGVYVVIVTPDHLPPFATRCLIER